ncbi:hypothetical protein OS493_039127, partial [Desmophyllum pertusum]
SKKKQAKICLRRSQFAVSSTRKVKGPLFTFTLNVNEQLWKFPEGRIAPGFRPFDRRKFSSCLLNGGLRSFEGYCVGTVDVAPGNAVTGPEVRGLSSPWMKEVRAVDISLNWLRRRSLTVAFNA